jgi:hypothetical protein
MFKKILKNITISFFCFLFFVFCFTPIVFANPMDLDLNIDKQGLINATNGGGITTRTSENGGMTTEKDLPNIFKTIITVILGFAGTISLGFVVYAGIQIMMSNGDKIKYDKHIKLMLTGGIAFLIVLFAYLISRFVLSSISVLVK